MGVSQKSADGSKLDGESLGKVMKVKVCSINPSEGISFKTPAGLNRRPPPLPPPPPPKKNAFISPRTSHCFSSRQSTSTGGTSHQNIQMLDRTCPYL